MRVPFQLTQTFEFPDVDATGLGARIDTPAGVPVVDWTPATLTLGVGWAVTLALPPAGVYVLTWRTPDYPPIRFEARIPLEIVAAANGATATSVASCTPTHEQIAALVLSRTRDDDTGELTGEFTASTRPSLQAVDELIERATGEVLDAIGVEVPGPYTDEVARVAAARVAGLITLSLDDPGTDPSAQRRFDAMYLTGIERLQTRPWKRAIEVL